MLIDRFGILDNNDIDVIAAEMTGAVQQGPVRARVLMTFQLKNKEGSELTKDDRESQLYDEFEHFCQIKGETIQGYYVRFKNVVGKYNANNQGRPFQRNNARGNVVARNVGGQNRGGIINPGQAKPIKRMVQYWMKNSRCFLQGEQVTNFDDDVDDSPENDLALNVDHVFEADECDALRT
ncbi:hypothetical protein Tco_1501398 [Tanacetum coccineum]